MHLFKDGKTIKTIIFVTIVFFAAIKLQIVNLDILSGKDSASIHFNLITVNSVFAGFLFSSLTLLIGLNATKTIVVLEKTDNMEPIYKNIINGLTSSLASIILSLICIFVIPSISKIPFVIKFNNIFLFFTKTLIPGLILLFIIFTIAYFIIATNDIKFIISSVRRKSKQNAQSKESIQKTLDSIK